MLFTSDSERKEIVKIPTNIRNYDETYLLWMRCKKYFQKYNIILINTCDFVMTKVV